MTILSNYLHSFKKLAATEPMRRASCELSLDYWAFFFNLNRSQKLKAFPNTTIFVCPDEISAETLYAKLKSHTEIQTDLILFTSSDHSPYMGRSSTERSTFELFSILARLSFKDKTRDLCLITTSINLIRKFPRAEFFHAGTIILNTEDIFSPTDLCEKLVINGYTSAISAEEPGTFCKKGSVLDIFPVDGTPVRINFYDDMIETISSIDQSNGRTIKNSQKTHVRVSPTPYCLCAEKYRSTLRNNVPMPPPQYANRFELRKNIFNKLSNGQLFDGHGDYLPLFFDNCGNLGDFFDTNQTIYIFTDEQACIGNISSFLDVLAHDFEQISLETQSFNLLPNPNELFFSLNLLQKFTPSITSNTIFLAETNQQALHLNTKTLLEQFGLQESPENQKSQLIKGIKNKIDERCDLIISFTSDAALNEITYLLELDSANLTKSNQILFLKNQLDRGFYLPTENTLVISDSDFFPKKTIKTKSKSNNNFDVFAEQLSTLTPGDFVIHSNHGVGKYLGLTKITNAENTSDYLVIEYEESDKIYLPVHKLHQLQKHADSTSNTKIANLRSNAFNVAKERARQSAKELAFDLIKLQADRQSTKSFAFSPPDHTYSEFELSFPFVETEDQKKASEDVINAMTRDTPMDFLVCGDVGFGKTEVAMRAAFKAVLDNKQVAVLVPTTILALQHYNSFTNRFKNFGVNINFLSRFKSPQEVKNIKEQMELGKIDIIIGTHKLLSKDIKYKDLGLVVVDEEQRFGVAHKEQLKLLKSTVDFLTLTATPIPRTLQLALFGLRELSIIQTAPPKRQSIATYVLKSDDFAIKDAIEKELRRGGQVYFVHNRVDDIESQRRRILDLVPNATVTIAHGQMPEKDLENRIKDFYLGKFQVLVCTTIIESGIDIPNANTMIVNRADTFGLSQLHQLRGRIGRSDRKAYAFFLTPESRNLSSIAESRLKALKNYAELGAGFSIASCDLEIRGAGDILGASQSGHIATVGLELYMELLQEVINELKGQPKQLSSNIEISTSFPCYLPDSYIPDPGTRLKYYKKLSRATKDQDLIELFDSISDQFGKSPIEVHNLITVLRVKILFSNLGVKSINVIDASIIIAFDKDFINNNPLIRNKILDYVLGHKKRYQVTPDYKVLYSHTAPIDQNTLLEISKNIALQIVPC